MTLSSAKYRLTYEAFSKFSAYVSKAESIEELIAIISKRSKYLFDCHLLRLSFNRKNSTTIFTVSREHTRRSYGLENLFCYEKKLLEEHIPYCEKLRTPLFDDFLDYKTLQQPRLWGWHFNYGTHSICTSLVADDVKKFNNTDKNILHLMINAVSTKIQELQYKKDLEQKNQKLEAALLIIEKKNLEISEIIKNQKAVIASRTQEIRDQNNKLLKISKMNAHQVREPLSRILGLIEVARHCNTEDLQSKVLIYLQQSAIDLDTTLNEIIQVSAGKIKKILE